MFALGILNHTLRMDDALIGMIASTFDLLAAIAFFLASQSWQLFYSKMILILLELAFETIKLFNN